MDSLLVPVLARRQEREKEERGTTQNRAAQVFYCAPRQTKVNDRTRILHFGHTVVGIVDWHQRGYYCGSLTFQVLTQSGHIFLENNQLWWHGFLGKGHNFWFHLGQQFHCLLHRSYTGRQRESLTEQRVGFEKKNGRERDEKRRPRARGANQRCRN